MVGGTDQLRPPVSPLGSTKDCSWCNHLDIARPKTQRKVRINILTLHLQREQRSSRCRTIDLFCTHLAIGIDSVQQTSRVIHAYLMQVMQANDKGPGDIALSHLEVWLPKRGVWQAWHGKNRDVPRYPVGHIAPTRESSEQVICGILARCIRAVNNCRSN